MGPPEICKAGYVRSSFSGHFRSWRSQNGKPLKAVAQELGVGLTTVSKWELGQRFPTAENLEAIAQYTGIPLCHFFCPGRKECARLARIYRLPL
ncbi:MAG: helix-turn-helix transcriptional regulator [Lentisphaerae bacterium]|nr:helix-turn-helix transcriptional regulator [Lentisphaerota bacterium]